MIDPVALADAVWALLVAVPNLKSYRGEIPQDDPPDVMDAATGRVAPYAVLYAGPGRGHATALSEAPRDHAASWQVTCVGGDENGCLWAVSRVRAALLGQRLAVTGAGDVGLVEEPFDLGPARRDDQVQPPRHYVPLQFAVSLTG